MVPRASRSPQFKAGDIVELKSGGPKMTVQKLNHNYGGDFTGYHCQWFKGGTLAKGDFPEESLLKSEEKKAKDK